MIAWTLTACGIEFYQETLLQEIFLKALGECEEIESTPSTPVMAKKSKLLNALDAAQGRNYYLERQSKMQKAAEKKKRLKAKAAEEGETKDEAVCVNSSLFLVSFLTVCRRLLMLLTKSE